MANNAKALFEAERAALMAGDFAALQEISAKLEAYEQSIASGGISKEELRDVVAEAQRNTSLLQAAVKGVQSAQTRLKAITDVRDNLSLYTRGGKKQSIALSHKGLEKKA